MPAWPYLLDKIYRAEGIWLDADLRAEVAWQRDQVIEAESRSREAYEQLAGEAWQLDKEIQTYASFFA